MPSVPTDEGVPAVDCGRALTAAEIDRLAADGRVVVDGWLDDAAIDRVLDGLERAPLQPARIGRADAARRIEGVRGDAIAWLDAARHPVEARLLARLEALRRQLAHSLRMPLQEVEAHFARYPPGSGYAWHRDRFHDDDARLLSLVCYLNRHWRPGHGGWLCLYGPPEQRIAPLAGRLVLFDSRLEHAVAETTVPRSSLAGWFRRAPVLPGLVR